MPWRNSCWYTAVVDDGVKPVAEVILAFLMNATEAPAGRPPVLNATLNNELVHLEAVAVKGANPVCVAPTLLDGLKIPNE